MWNYIFTRPDHTDDNSPTLLLNSFPLYNAIKVCICSKCLFLDSGGTSGASDDRNPKFELCSLPKERIDILHPGIRAKVKTVKLDFHIAHQVADVHLTHLPLYPIKLSPAQPLFEALSLTN